MLLSTMTPTTMAPPSAAGALGPPRSSSSSSSSSGRGGGGAAPVPALQEGAFACVDDDDDLDNAAATAQHPSPFGHPAPSTTRRLPTHALPVPPHLAASPLPLPPSSLTRALECTGSGAFYFQHASLRHRFLTWRVAQRTLVVREWGLHATLAGNGLRLELPAAIVPAAVTAVECWGAAAVVLGILTHAGTIHRLTFAIPPASAATPRAGNRSSTHKSTDPEATPAPTLPSLLTAAPFAHRVDVVGALHGAAPRRGEAITTGQWVNEFNLLVATDAGRIVGVNFGLPGAPEAVPQEFVFSDESMVRWLWKGLAGGGSGSGGSGVRDELPREAIVAMALFPIEATTTDDHDDDDDVADDDSELDPRGRDRRGGDGSGEVEDVCILTLSADFTLRAWSFRNQVCLGRQCIRALVRTTPDLDDSPRAPNAPTAAAAEVLAVVAKLVAIPAATTGACRILVHVDSNDEYSQQIVLLRGDIGGSRQELALEVARVFTVGAGKRLKFVDFAVEKGFLHSAWRSPAGDFVYSHASPMAMTGPRVIPGSLVSSLDVQMKKYEAEDRELPFKVADEDAVTRVDEFFAERVLLPGRFSRQCLYKAISEFYGGVDVPLRQYFTQFGPQESRYKDLLIRVVSEKCLQLSGASNSGRSKLAPPGHVQQRIGTWKTIIDLCTKHWRSEVAPIGFASAPSVMMLGSPVLLRRNRVSLLFPSATTIASSVLSKSITGSKESVHDIVTDVLPAFDAFPSQAFQSSIQGEFAEFTGDWKVESLITRARLAVRLAMRPGTTSSVGPEVQLTRALLRLSQVLGGDAAQHGKILQDLVDGLAPMGDSTGELSQEHDSDMSMMDDNTMASGNRYFGGVEACFSFSQVAARSIDELCLLSLRAVLCLSYLVDARPSFLEGSTIQAIERVMLPKAIIMYQRWSLSRWLANQNVMNNADTDVVNAKTTGTLLPPLLQLFLVEANEGLNQGDAFLQARYAAEMRDFDTSDSEEPHKLLTSFLAGILELVVNPNDQLVSFLQRKQEFSILRSMLSCGLNDVDLRGSMDVAAPIRVKYIRSIGECLAWEGSQAAQNGADDDAMWYLKQAIRCFNMCLSAYVSQVETDASKSVIEEIEQFITSSVQLLKETVPRGLYRLTLSFLWVIATEALEHMDGKSLKSFVWVNIFKYSVEEQQFRDAHLALMRTVQSSSLGQSMDADLDNRLYEEGEEDSATRTAIECANYFVKELCRHGRVDLVCDFQWGALESEVEEQLQWLSANANTLKDGCVDPSVVMYHQLLYAFYARRNQPANAASAMHALYLRLRSTATTSAVSLHTQRNALLAATTILRELADEHRWVVRKIVPDEGDSKTRTDLLNIVSWDDMDRDLTVLEGKLRLLEVGHEESVLLMTMGATEVVALLVDASLCCADPEYPGTKSEKQQDAIMSLELAVQIAEKNNVKYHRITKSIARYCVSHTKEHGIDFLAWDLLKTYLRFVDKLEQYEVAAEAILSWKDKFVLPEWISQRLCCRKSGNASKLVLLYLNHGLLIEAATTAAAMIPMEIVAEGEAAFRKRANNASAGLPWLPYNVFDKVLNAADAALTNSNGSFVVPASHPPLRAATQRLRDCLVEYFKYIHTLEQARQAANVVRNG